MPSYMSISQAAECYSVSTKTIRRRIADGSLPAYRSGKLIRLRRDELDAHWASVQRIHLPSNRGPHAAR